MSCHVVYECYVECTLSAPSPPPNAAGQNPLEGEAASSLSDPPPGKRVMRFWLQEAKTPEKLDYTWVALSLGGRV